ncbi:hypothetical protein E4U09_006877 [Claviceps aff. purpurea]|uniref:Uncharacterized protein n=1 Tax=Claviceps aff. purpurea TaxID=1967640 RepID=A0A9P7QF22_9HYPO|nr:hypothetical protein E4U09_006877 [Claviceps aff. purpurea]
MSPLGEIDLNVQKTPTTVNAPPFLKAKKGSKKRRLVDRLDSPLKPVACVERTYSARKRDAIFMFLVHHRIHDPDNKKSMEGP